MTKKTLVYILTLVTALIHIVLGLRFISDTLGVLFVLNGLGYLALLAGLYVIPQLESMRGLLRYALMGFAAVTIVSFFAVQGSDAFSAIPGLVTKVVELALIVVLWLDRPAGAAI